MVLRETVSFVFPSFLRLGKYQDSGKHNLQVPRGTIHKVLCYIFRLSLKQSSCKNMPLYSGNNCVMVSQSGHIGIWSGARDQESTNLSARFVEWNFTYVTISNDTSLRYYGDLNACGVSYLRHKSAVKRNYMCCCNFLFSELLSERKRRQS